MSFRHFGHSSASGRLAFERRLTTHTSRAGFYDFSKKIDKSLEEVHVDVPQFNEKILKSVERTLKRFEAHQPFERSSWEIVDDYNLYHRALPSPSQFLASYLMCDELTPPLLGADNIADLHDGGKLPDDIRPQDLYFRCDHQTFRKLPKSRGIIFGVHPILRRLEELADLPLVPALLATIHEQASEDLMKYKLAPMCEFLGDVDV